MDGKVYILMFREVLEMLQYPDIGVTRELQIGADLTGGVPRTSV